ILRDGEIGEEAQFLERRGDAGRTRLEDRPCVVLGPGEPDRAAVARNGAAENFDQRRLAGAVLAEDGMDLAAFRFQRDGTQGGGGAVALREILDAEHAFAAHLSPPAAPVQRPLRVYATACM